MTTKTLLIYLIISIIAFAFVIIPKSEVEYYQYLDKKLTISNEILEYANQSILQEIQKTVSVYPQFSSFLKKAIFIDSTTNTLIETEKINLEQVNVEFLDLVENPTRKAELQLSLSNFESFFVGENTIGFLKSSLNESVLRINELVFFNYFALNSSGHFHYFGAVEPVLLRSKSAVELGKSHEVQIVLTESFSGNKLKINSILVNDESLVRRDGKARFKTKAAKSGWNEMNILVNATFKGKAMQKEKVFRYYVK